MPEEADRKDGPRSPRAGRHGDAVDGGSGPGGQDTGSRTLALRCPVPVKMTEIRKEGNTAVFKKLGIELPVKSVERRKSS